MPATDHAGATIDRHSPTIGSSPRPREPPPARRDVPHRRRRWCATRRNAGEGRRASPRSAGRRDRDGEAGIAPRRRRPPERHHAVLCRPRDVRSPPPADWSERAASASADRAVAASATRPARAAAGAAGRPRLRQSRRRMGRASSVPLPDAAGGRWPPTAWPHRLVHWAERSAATGTRPSSAPARRREEATRAEGRHGAYQARRWLRLRRHRADVAGRLRAVAVANWPARTAPPAPDCPPTRRLVAAPVEAGHRRGSWARCRATARARIDAHVPPSAAVARRLARRLAIPARACGHRWDGR